jgi:hypothetical protein
VTFQKAQAYSVKTARLPIQEYMVRCQNGKNFHSEILAINQGTVYMAHSHCALLLELLVLCLSTPDLVSCDWYAWNLLHAFCGMYSGHWEAFCIFLVVPNYVKNSWNCSLCLECPTFNTSLASDFCLLFRIQCQEHVSWLAPSHREPFGNMFLCVAALPIHRPLSVQGEILVSRQGYVLPSVLPR